MWWIVIKLPSVAHILLNSPPSAAPSQWRGADPWRPRTVESNHVIMRTPSLSTKRGGSSCFCLLLWDSTEGGLTEDGGPRAEGGPAGWTDAEQRQEQPGADRAGLPGRGSGTWAVPPRCSSRSSKWNVWVGLMGGSNPQPSLSLNGKLWRGRWQL